MCFTVDAVAYLPNIRLTYQMCIHCWGIVSNLFIDRSVAEYYIKERDRSKLDIKKIFFSDRVMNR